MRVKEDSTDVEETCLSVISPIGEVIVRVKDGTDRKEQKLPVPSVAG